jgi:hypothetical protein
MTTEEEPKMPNTNCLEDMQCPKRGNEDAFLIEVQQVMLVTDDGTEDAPGYGSEWDNDSSCACVSCKFQDEVREFLLPHEEEEE